jgi:hypothetical protein
MNRYLAVLGLLAVLVAAGCEREPTEPARPVDRPVQQEPARPADPPPQQEPARPADSPPPQQQPGQPGQPGQQ